MGAPGSAKLFGVFLSADRLGARSPGQFPGLYPDAFLLAGALAARGLLPLPEAGRLS